MPDIFLIIFKMEVSGKVRKVLVALCLVFLSLCSIGVFVYSFFQITDIETDDAGFTISCGDPPYDTNQPLRFRNTETSSFVDCGWQWSNTSLRLAVSLACGLLPFLAIFFGIIRKKKWVMWMTTLFCFVAMLLFVGVLVLDCEDVSSSLSWCKDYELAEDCAYAPYFGMIIIEVIVAVTWCGLGIVLCYYCSRHMKSDYSDFIFDYTEDNSYYSS